MKLRCLLIDDEYLSLDVLENYLKQVPHLELVGSFTNPVEALAKLHEQNIDLLFCDVQMPQLSGLHLVESLPNQPMVVFTTAFKEHALEGFELDAVDFLVKPIRFERFLKAANKATELATLKRQQLQFAQEPQPKNYQMIKVHHKTLKVLHSDILYIEGLREYVTYHTVAKKLVALESLKQLEIALPKDFMRIHKSYIVSLSKVDSLVGNMLEIGGRQIPIGGSYREQVLEAL